MSASVTRDDIFDLLSVSRLGGYGTAPDGTAVLWNRRAEQILGHMAGDVLGRRIDSVLGASAAVASDDDTTTDGTTTEAAAPPSHSDGIRSPAVVPLRCGSGAYKNITLTVLVIVDDPTSGTVLVSLFDESADAATDGEDEVAGVQSPRAAPASSRVPYVDSGVAHLSSREQEILELVAVGRSPEQIARMLDISIHTVRNHVRNLRAKLKAKTKLDAVMAAVRQGLL